MGVLPSDTYFMFILMVRCVNIDWLEVYVLESEDRFPCNADYYRREGYVVHEREYGTRVYDEMFVIDDERGDSWLEVRRHPASGQSSFTGLDPNSSHIRLVNRACYFVDAVSRLRDFLLKHNYLFKRIFRIDICYDFTRFDWGDLPERFLRLYIERKFAKMNQIEVATHGHEGWGAFSWQYISWGSRTSMVSTKMYNKTRELAEGGHDKPYIRYAWMQAGLIDNPVIITGRDNHGRQVPVDVWRIEFSMKSKADRWLVIEDISGKKVKKKAIPHTLEMFDSPDKLWQRFQDLAYHYFRFKIVAWQDDYKGAARFALDSVRSDLERNAVRKDRCPDKRLFRWDKDHQFLSLSMVPKESQKVNDYEACRRRLNQLAAFVIDPKVKQAIHIILEWLDRQEIGRVVTERSALEIDVMQRVIAAKTSGDERDAWVIAATIRELLVNNSIF